jgi:RimJ/RimL family protein N-acetyltransferase
MAIALRTPRLLLREWRDEDWAPFVALAADPVAMQYLPPLDERQSSEWIGFARRHW